MIITYVFLFLSVILLWALPSKIPIWAFTLAITLALGLTNHLLQPIALIPIIALAILLYAYEFQKHAIIGILILAISVALAMHFLPGFHNLKVIYPQQLSFYLNIDKATAGILMLGMTMPLIHSRKDWLSLFLQLLIWMPLVIAIMIGIALSLHYVHFAPHLPKSFFLWSITNLLLVCTAEEAIFRGFIQKNLSVYFKKSTFGNFFAILIAAILFGLIHYKGGIQYILLATCAGIGYGYVYLKTKCIEGSILTHFALNLTRFLLFI